MKEDARYLRYKAAAEEAVEKHLAPACGRSGRLGEAMRYALAAGGKRVRPVLLLAAAASLPERAERATDAVLGRLAAAVEMVHTYSLIHDDLPCMDDDRLRRGRPCTHVVFGEALGLLAGDALLNRAFELMLEALEVAQSDCPPALAGTLAGVRAMGLRFGQSGMIGGQVIDLAAEKQRADLATLEELVLKKTAALIEAALLGGAAAAGADAEELALFARFGAQLGLAFQICDDILDCTSDAETMGKTVGKDQRDGKSTYVALLGMDEARRRAEAATAAAMRALDGLRARGCDETFLRAFARDLLERRH